VGYTLLIELHTMPDATLLNWHRLKRKVPTLFPVLGVCQWYSNRVTLLESYDPGKIETGPAGHEGTSIRALSQLGLLTRDETPVLPKSAVELSQRAWVA